MSSRKRKIIIACLACAALVIVVTTHAHNAGYDVASPGVPAAAITINGVEGGGEWTGAASVALSDYSDPMFPGNPLSGTLKALHKADGIYLLINVSDPTNNPNDSVQIRFDINHNGSVGLEATDWGAEVLRSGQAIWGAADAGPGAWAPVPGGTAGVTSSGSGWVVEFRLPTGAPSQARTSASTPSCMTSIRPSVLTARSSRNGLGRRLLTSTSSSSTNQTFGETIFSIRLLLSRTLRLRV
jgi:Carbohydrate family 9 binding domain-like